MPDQNLVVAVFIGLITTAIGVAIGWTWRRTAEVIKLRRIRELWRPFAGGDAIVILSAFDEEFKDFDPSGGVGLGDAMAFAELRSFFVTLGVPDLPLRFANRDVGDMLRRNLILLGGPHGNSVTADVLSKLPVTMTFSDISGDPVIYDSNTKTQYAPSLARVFSRGDLALIVRARNPYSRAHSVLVIAGSYAFGTWGGARFLIDDTFSNNHEVVHCSDVECVVEVDVSDRVPQANRILVRRDLGRN